MENKKGESIAKYIEVFREFDQTELALKLAREGYAGPVVYYLRRFEGVDEEQLVDLLIEQGNGNTLATRIGAFRNIDKVDVGRRLLKEGVVDAVAENITEFDGLPVGEVFLALPPERRIDLIVRNSRTLLPHLSAIQDIDHQQLARELMAKSCHQDLLNNLHHFKNIDTVEVARSVIGTRDGVDGIVKNIYRFDPLPIDVAAELIRSGHTSLFLREPKYFVHLDANELLSEALKITNVGYALHDYGIDKLRGLTAETARQLLEAGYAKYITSGISAFRQSDERLIYEMLKGEKLRSHDHLLLSHFHSLTEEERLKLLEDKEEIHQLGWTLQYRDSGPVNLSNNIAKILIDSKEDLAVSRHLDHFAESDHDEIARSLIKSGRVMNVFDDLSSFKNLSVETLRRAARKYRGEKEILKVLKRRMRSVEPNILKRFFSRF